jgi:hypothetical protein
MNSVGADMPKFVVLTGAILLLPSYSFAQDLSNHPNPSQCQQIRQAVAQYGYAAAKQYAMQNYGPEAVRFGEQCFAGQATRSIRHDAFGAAVVPVDER